MKIERSNQKRIWFAFFSKGWSWYGKWTFFRYNTFRIHRCKLTHSDYFEVCLFGNVFYIILREDK